MKISLLLFVSILLFSVQSFGNCADLYSRLEDPLAREALAVSRLAPTLEAKDDGLHIAFNGKEVALPEVVLKTGREREVPEKEREKPRPEVQAAVLNSIDPTGKLRQAYERLPAAARKAFTLMETIVVMAISAVLMGLLLGGLNAARTAADKMRCTNNLKEITLALTKYADDHEGRLPRVDELWDRNNKLNSLLPLIEDNTTVLTCPSAPPADGTKYRSLSQNFPGSPQLNYGYNYQALGLPVYSNFTPPRANLNNPNLSLSSTLVFQDNMDSNPYLYLSDTSRAYPPRMFNDPTVGSTFYYPTGHFRHPSLYGNGGNSSAQISFLDGHVESTTEKYEANPMPNWITPELADFRRKNNIYSVGRNNHWWNPKWSGQNDQP